MNHTAAYRVYRDTWDTDQPHTSYTVEIMRPDNQRWQRIAVADTRESALLAARLFCSRYGWRLSDGHTPN
mgnify:CR=1 FL=1